MLLLVIVALGCGTSQPIGPLEGAYAVVFDSTFAAVVRSGSASFSGRDLEDAVKQLFTERDATFHWFHDVPKDKANYDAIVVLHIARVPSASVTPLEPRNPFDPGNNATLSYEVQRKAGRKTSGALNVTNPVGPQGRYEPRMLLDTASDLYSVLARELQI